MLNNYTPIHALLLLAIPVFKKTQNQWGNAQFIQIYHRPTIVSCQIMSLSEFLVMHVRPWPWAKKNLAHGPDALALINE